MKKPLSIRKDEFTRTLAEVINGSELPACVVADTMSILLSVIQGQADEQLLRDRKEYARALEEEKSEKTEVKEDAAYCD